MEIRIHNTENHGLADRGGTIEGAIEPDTGRE